MMKDKRTRFQYRFWLDITKSMERELAEQVDALKRGRSFSTFIRDGLRLMIDLSAGNVEVLVELFPWVADRFNGQPVQIAQQPAVDKAWLEDLLQGALMRIQETRQGAGPKPLTSRTFALPEFDEDEGISQLIVTHAGKGDSAFNFIHSVLPLQ
jgi:Arc/MetJ-type ribon-helix-helix transcriptional regulator